MQLVLIGVGFWVCAVGGAYVFNRYLTPLYRRVRATRKEG